MPGKIFVNYRRDDSAAHALNVAQYLERTFGARNVFLDIDRMRAGQNFPDVLNDKLSACKVMIAVIGPSWVTLTNDDGQRRLDDPEDWVRLEIAHALKRNIAVIPILVGGAVLPKKSDLPDDLKPLLQRHVATITTNGFRNEMAGLVRDIKAIPQPMPWGKIGTGAIAALVFTVGAWHWFQQPATIAWSPTAIRRDKDAASKAISTTRAIAQSDASRAADEVRNRNEALAEVKKKAEADETKRLAAIKADADRKAAEAASRLEAYKSHSTPPAAAPPNPKESAAETWVELGSFLALRGNDEFVIKESTQRVTAIRLWVTRGNIYCDLVEVFYGDGIVHKEQRKLTLLENERSRPINRTDRPKSVDRVKLSCPSSSSSAFIEVQGLTSPASDAVPNTKPETLSAPENLFQGIYRRGSDDKDLLNR